MMDVSKPLAKKTKMIKPVLVKSFRLLDFHVFDEVPTEGSGSGTDSGDDSSTSYRKYKPATDDNQFVIQMFGVNEKGESCCMYIQDYYPFFYVRVGDTWTKTDMNQFVEDIKTKIDKRYRESILDYELVDHHKLYGFSGGQKHKFVKIIFKNTMVMNKVKNLWYTYVQGAEGSRQGGRVGGGERKRIPYIFKNRSLELYESNIPPVLRYFHIHNISPSGWVSFRTNRVLPTSTKLTTCKYEYIIPLKELTPQPEKETGVPYKICSFDIEASSSHGDFPVPIKSYKRLATNLVDAYSKRAAQQPLDAAKVKSLVQSVMLAAFNYGKFDEIDLVYPKRSVSKSTIQSRIQILVNESLEIAAKSNTEENNSYMLTLDTLFDKMKEMQDQHITGGDGEGDDNDVEEGNTDSTEAEDAQPTLSSPTNAKSKLNTSKRFVLEKNTTIIDVLLNTKYDRDTKIQISNEVLTKLFPGLEGDKVTFIGSTFMRYGEPEPYLNHCLVVGSCDPVDGAIIESMDTEKSLLMRWTELIQEENPDIIIGYNIFGFDYEFMFRRSQENECERQFLQLSRKVGDVCAKTNAENQLEIENTKLAIASGEYDLRFFKMIGRLQIDMYAYFRRDFNLSSYKLDDVAGQFICDDIKRLVCCERRNGDGASAPVTELWTQNLTGLHVGDYIHIELTGFTADYYKNGQKFKVLDIEFGRQVTETVKGKECVNTYNVIIIAGHEDIQGDKSIKWTVAKDDVTPQDIFRLSNGSASDRAIVAKYCIQDCNLVHHLMNKIDVITGYVEMARICSVPISFLVFRGQGIKLTSFVAKKCREKDTLMPDLEKTGDADGYEGAIVLPPKCSMYMDNPVACVDYSSLYPSSMISQNYSHDSKVWTKEYDLAGNMIRMTGERNKQGDFIYDNLPGYHYINIEFDTFKYIRKTKTSRAEKTKVGKMICRWAQFPDNRKGIMPSILEELLKARKDTRNQIKTEKDPFMQNILDKRQLGYKVTANSLYGQCGSRTSTFYEKDVAASTTATGRMMITYARRIIEEVYGDRVYETAVQGPVRTRAEYVYGDSVANYTPVYVRHNKTTMDICAVEELADKYGIHGWSKCKEEGKQEKEICELQNLESWTERGWTPLFRVIRHALAPHKKMVRVLTHTGLVDVTDDHSLIKKCGTEISPNDCLVGTELLHHVLPESFNNVVNDIKLEEAYVLGFFFGHKKSKIIPNEILYGDIEVRQSFWEGMYDADGDKDSNGYIRIDQNNQISASHIAYLANSLGFNFSINTRKDKQNIYRITMTNKNQRKNPIAIKKLHTIDYSGYVYDLTTENHHFAAGIGNMIVHNTDSVFFTFNLENPETGEKIRGKPALEMTIEIAQDAAELCTQWLKPPMELSYEKTLMPFILLSKKRYVGMLYETDPNKGKLKYMGLSLKRRDSCDYLKDVYGKILKILMDTKTDGNIGKAIQFLEDSLQDLVAGRVSMDKLAITKALRGDYKNPHTIGHKVLADRIGQRDPGNKPKPGDRMKFVFIVNPDPKALMGDKIETPDYIIENKLTIDYTHYITNQLMKPLQQLFGLALEQIWELQNKKPAIRLYRRDMEKMRQDTGDDIETFMKNKEKYCSKKIKAILFDKVLTQIFNKKNGIRQISTFFG